MRPDKKYTKTYSFPSQQYWGDNADTMVSKMKDVGEMLDKKISEFIKMDREKYFCSECVSYEERVCEFGLLENCQKLSCEKFEKANPLSLAAKRYRK